MKNIIILVSSVLFAVFFLVAFVFEWLSNTTTWGMFVGLMLIATATLFIAEGYNNKD
jgi:hypothetical protein